MTNEPHSDSLVRSDKRWTRVALLNEATRLLEESGVAHPDRNARWMMQEAMGGLSHAALRAHPEREVKAEHVARLRGMLRRRLRGEPLQYVVGHTDFYGLRLRVTPAVLIPRPETERVVEQALDFLDDVPAPRILDVGTGSGCIALALAQARPKATVYACDVSEAALEVAAENAARHDLSVSFFQADVLAETFADRAPVSLDLMISNPPYVADEEAGTLPPDVREHEPHEALFAGANPLRYYRALAWVARPLLAAEGRLVLETHAEQGRAVQRLLRQHGYANVMLHRDWADRPRIVTARLGAET